MSAARTLPIYQLERDILAAAGAAERLVIQAPTGSGKSTQVPQMLLAAGLLERGECVVLQPRRLPARMLAGRVAAERGTRLGDEVGYQIRFERVASDATRIRFVTEGVLLRQMLNDPDLRGVAVILFDEFHERHLYGDITLARALDLQETRRPELRLVVMSATLDIPGLRRFLTPCRVLQCEGRTFPVTITHLPKAPPADEPLWETAARTLDRLANQTEGDVLVFMPGAYEIARTVAAVQALPHDFVVLPLHGELPPDQQDAAMARYERRKVVVATNVAETSLTIDGVRLVIDSGLARIPRFDPHRGINTLLVEKISQASADQRAGRAGRTAPGLCVRLWTEHDHALRPVQTPPEVKRLDLAEAVLTLKAGGVWDVSAFRWFEPPDPQALARAESLLLDLGALAPAPAPANAGTPPGHTTGTVITPIGRRMLAFPVHPRYARMLLAARDLGCVPQAALVAALAQGRPLLQRDPDKLLRERRSELLGEEADSDFFVLLRAFKFAQNHGFRPQPCRRLGIHAGAAREAAALYAQFLRIANTDEAALGVPAAGAAATVPAAADGQDADSAIRKCLLAGFADHLALRLDRGTLRCALVHGRRALLTRDSAVRHAPLLVAAEIREQEVNGELTTLLSLATAVEPQWLRELFPTAFSESVEAVFDPTLKRVVSRRVQRFQDLILATEISDKVPPSQATEILAGKVLAGEATLSQWTPAVDQWIVRVNRLCEWMPDLGLPPIDDTARRLLLAQICDGATSLREIRDRPVWPTVRAWLSPVQQQMVEQLVPDRLVLPGGRAARIHYRETGPPCLAATIQQLYGLEGKLTVCAGRVPLLIEVLAPNQRPVQVTQDLATFWRETYPRLKTALQRKYPRHEWR